MKKITLTVVAILLMTGIAISQDSAEKVRYRLLQEGYTCNVELNDYNSNGAQDIGIMYRSGYDNYPVSRLLITVGNILITNGDTFDIVGVVSYEGKWSYTANVVNIYRCGSLTDKEEKDRCILSTWRR